MEISRREGIHGSGQNKSRSIQAEGVVYRIEKDHPHSDLSEKNNSDPFRIDQKIIPFEISNVQEKKKK